MSNRKKKILIINPSKQTLDLISTSTNLRNIDFSFLDTNLETKNAILNALQNASSFNRIYIENYSGNNFDNEILLEVNRIQVLNNKIQDIGCFIEKHFKKIQILNINGNWVSTRELINLNVNKSVEFSKRLFDLFFVISTLPVSILLILAGALIIKVSSDGPIFFKQFRVGKSGNHFMLYKLRTMRVNSDSKKFTVENDSRVFPAGRFLRTTKIDELPQFLNILLGHMSLIGPRPETVEIVQDLDSQNSYYELRHLIRPGISGWAQVNDPKANPTQNFQKLEYDLYYIKNLSLIMDFKIILSTIRIIFQRNSL